MLTTQIPKIPKIQHNAYKRYFTKTILNSSLRFFILDIYFMSNFKILSQFFFVFFIKRKICNNQNSIEVTHPL